MRSWKSSARLDDKRASIATGRSCDFPAPLLRRGRRARTRGNHPFGAILVSATGEVLIETENGYLPDRDMTAHAERLLATQASKQFDRQVLAGGTLYTSAEPVRCAPAQFTGRASGASSRVERTSPEGNNRRCAARSATLDLPCRVVGPAGQRGVEVIGPLLEAIGDR